MMGVAPPGPRPAPAPMPSPVSVVTELYGFTPHSKLQWDILHCPAKEVSILAGIQWGKSQTSAYYVCCKRMEIKFQRRLAADAAERERPLIIWLISRKYENSDREYVYLRDLYTKTGEIQKSSAASRYRPREILLKDGTTIRTLTSTETENIGRERPDIIVVCEAAQVGLHAVERLRARRAVGHGYLILSGTLETSFGWYAQLHRQWADDTSGDFAAFFAPSWDNPYVFPGGRDDPDIIRAEQTLPQRVFLERFAAVVQTPLSYIFGDSFDPAIHVRSPDDELASYVPGEPVSLGIDPGYAHAHAIEVIQHPDGGPVRVIDEIYKRGWSVQRMIEEAKMRPWAKDAHSAVIDFAGTIHQQAVDPPFQVWQQLWPNLNMLTTHTPESGVPGRVPVMSGIQKLWQMFEPTVFMGEIKPRIVISQRCHGLLSELGYEASPITGLEQVYSWSVDGEGRLLRNKPKDLHNDAVKALTYWCVTMLGYVEGAARLTQPGVAKQVVAQRMSRYR